MFRGTAEIGFALRELASILLLQLRDGVRRLLSAMCLPDALLLPLNQGCEFTHPGSSFAARTTRHFR